MTGLKLSADEWRAASTLLDEVLELPADARLNWVDGLAGENSALKPLLRKLLARQDLLETGDFPGTPPRVAALAALQQERNVDSLLAGALIGAYRLVRELGRGGMGTVWLAERADALIKRPVALKLPHPALYDEHFAERFARERDILAALSHRSIARLYDAGISAAGQPFLALEYVEGTALTEYCDRRGLPIAARLALYLEVLHAVQYAHTLRVIHRDLKPSNILVTASGEVRLLDFGIARMLPEGCAEESELTRIGGPALTMDYAAPEQILRQPVGVESDIYSLGVILYELLTGARPYRPARDSLGALEEAILHQDPVRPSAAVIAEGAAKVRAVTLGRLRAALRGDLDTIVLKALRKRPADRYASVEAFALDLQRHLRGEPVEARADTALYRLGKFASRNKILVGATALALGALAVGIALSIWQARIARAQAVAAVQEAKRAQVVQNFLVDIFRTNSHLQSDPQKARQTTARELLDAGAQRADTDLKDAPAAEEQVLATLADMYMQLGLEDQAVALLQQRETVAKRAYGARDPRVAEVLSSYARALADGPNRARIPSLLEEAIQILDAAHDGSSALRGGVYVDFASYYRYTSLDNSRRYADFAVALLEDKHPKDDTLLLARLLAGRARTSLGQYPAAVSEFQRTLVDTARLKGRGTAWDVAPLAQLAGAEAELLQVVDAEKNFRGSLDLSRRLNGEAHNETLQSQTRLGAFLESTSRRLEGRTLIEGAWRVFLADSRKRHNSIASLLYGVYGQALLDDGEIQRAQALSTQEVQEARGLYPESMLLARALLRQASVHIALGQYTAADAELQEALTAWRHVAGPGADPALENPYLFAMARLALARRRPAEARGLLSQVHRAAYAPTLPVELDELQRRVLLAQAYLQEERSAAALPTARAALAVVQSARLRQYLQPLEAEAALTLGEAERRNGLLGDARAHLSRALELQRANNDPRSTTIAQAELTLAACLSDLGERKGADALSHHAADVLASHRELYADALKTLRTFP
jgi:serine/threonine-protein kinase